MAPVAQSGLSRRPVDPNIERELSSTGLHPVMARLYAARGITHPREIAPNLADLHHHLLLKNSEEAAARLAQAILAQERVIVVADYDADGATACAVAVRGLRILGLDSVDFFVPNRFRHGYGLSRAIVEELAPRRPSLIITVDNGIASIDGVAAAKSHAIDTLVTDHHLAADTLPDALIVNPNQPGCQFPSKALAGVGTIFYVLLATRAELAVRHDPAYAKRSLAPLLDLVALGTVADVVALDHNNRILVEHGLRRIRAGAACAGINALFAAANRDKETATASDLGFSIGPRLNAAGRLDDMSVGIRCLLTDDPVQARELASKLQALNLERREIEEQMQTQALAIPAIGDVATQFALTLYQPDWHAGVVGLVASRIKEKYYRPVVCFARGDAGELKGSGRSIPPLHLRDALDRVSKQHPGLITKFGGHAMAAGLTIQESSLADFEQAFEAAVQQTLVAEDLVPDLWHDGELEAADIDARLAQNIAAQVWGQGFPPPAFLGKFRVISQRSLKDKHLKLELQIDGNRHGATLKIPGILFNRAEPLPDEITARYSLDWNVFRGTGSVQIRILDWQA